jgi:quercetin dioxygenase-like cupin family protein
MIIGHMRDVEKGEVQAEGVEGAAIQWLLGPKQEVPHFHMRYVTVEPGGVIPLHSHGPIHQMFIVKGQGAVLYEGGETPIEAGSFVYMPSKKVHGTRNTGSGSLEFVCCINKLDGKP